MCACELCLEVAWGESQDGYCIYHAPENGNDIDTARQVWEEARRRGGSANPMFYGWHFPEDPDGKGFDLLDFTAPALFENAVFAGSVTFRKATFPKGAVFKKAKFVGEARFRRATFMQGASFQEVSFASSASFSTATFKGSVSFSQARFGGKTDFIATKFANAAEFMAATFGGDTHFVNAVFEGDVYFHVATFKRNVDFSNAKASGGVCFDLPKGARPFARPEQGEVPYRLAKQSARNQGDYGLAGKYHYAERCVAEYGRRKDCGWRLWRPRFWLNWLEFVLVRLLFGYGEKPARVLVAALLIIACSWGLYYALDGINTDGRDLGAALHFSVVTFTTLGYGDIEPKPHCRWLADIEALSGAVLTALFIVSLARKYTR